MDELHSFEYYIHCESFRGHKGVTASKLAIVDKIKQMIIFFRKHVSDSLKISKCAYAIVSLIFRPKICHYVF
jgi:hypothetical protein